ncbi:ABC transporter ATP-binding protein [Desulfobacula phenolica]|uniref:Iron complex transport system ATP-binding protein n=1 Tax=Desulfobacula phenolica TaxID=90732 RepID=A0A1H2HK03_9BACT|nr:ABC transporter ATP-binding protein [Desulfobacula phenolica]SDU32154.1 iron complex transport system ATP-binding protein [Desulfobacula phenolica]
MKPLLEIKNLSFRYQKKMILQDISFSVDPGEFVAVIGPNGCGKTTLIKTILKTIHPETGTIHIENKDIQTLSNKALAKRVAVVMQTIDPASMTVRDYVQLGRLPFFQKYQFFETRNDVDIAKKYMRLTDVARLADARINEISGGERQLASIARALTQEPALLILDEPTSHLDITHQVRILELINKLKKELSLTVLMVLHDLNLAAEYSDRLVLLNKKNGRIFKAGIPKEVLTEASIREVYHTSVRVRPNPVSNKPWIFLVNQHALDNRPDMKKD